MTANIRTTACRSFPIALAAALMAISFAPGCASLQVSNLSSFTFAKNQTADAKHPAMNILTMWQAAEGPGRNGVPTRGFLGQILFFGMDPAPLAVDGKVRIYLFDDHGTVQEQSRPIHEFDFDNKAWAAHLQASRVGPTYTVFLPYPRDDFHEAKCSLRLRFTPMAGTTLYSDPMTVLLPGPTLKTQTASGAAASSPATAPGGSPSHNAATRLPLNVGANAASRSPAGAVSLANTRQQLDMADVGDGKQSSQIALVSAVQVTTTNGPADDPLRAAMAESGGANPISVPPPASGLSPVANRSTRFKLQSAPASSANSDNESQNENEDRSPATAASAASDAGTSDSDGRRRHPLED